MINCLLCNSTDNEVICKVDSKKIIRRYLNAFKTDFSYLFNESEIKLIRCNSCDLRFFIPIVSGDEHFYTVLQKTNYYYREEKQEYNIAAQIINKGASILDVGCGKGEFKKFTPECNFIGLEFSSEAIKAGKENGCCILKQSIEEHAELHSGKYDFVTAFQVLEHVPNISDFIKSCAKCVKTGGKLIIAVPSDESYLYFSTNSILNMPPHHITRWTDKALINIASIISFNFINIFHDNLDNLHIKSYFSALIERSLPLKKTSSIKLIDDSLIYKMRTKVAGILANQMLKASTHPAWHGKGQNVTAVYQKL